MMDSIEQFYGNHINDFGATARGVGWKNEEAQYVRFAQLARIINLQKKTFSINDLGCGVGDLVTFLDEKKMVFKYFGYDMLPNMISLAKEKFPAKVAVDFLSIQDANEMGVADYTVASGIFNIRFGKNESEWLQYILEVLSIMDKKSIDGFAFNILTKYSDANLMKEELYYADPCFLFDYCKTRFSRNVALLHDYNQYDFTILVRKT